jgi:Uma2 family endonuclease
MTARPEAPPLTVEHYRNLPETGPRYQLIEGDLYMTPAPNRLHQDISRNLEFLLMKYLEEHPVGVLYHAPFDVYLTGNDVFQPDILIVLNERRQILTDAGAEGCPDFVVEILSPKTRRLDLENKMRIYARQGVQELWIIDPDTSEVLVYQFSRDLSNPVGKFLATDVLTSPLFPGLHADFRAVFGQMQRSP